MTNGFAWLFLDPYDDASDSIKVGADKAHDAKEPTASRPATAEAKAKANGDDLDRADELNKEAAPGGGSDDAASEKEGDSKPSTLVNGSTTEAAVPMMPQAVLQDMEIDKFGAHRVNKEVATVEFHVHWANGEKTWEPEWELQTQVPELIYDYWKQHKGREAATGLEVYHVFRLLRREVPLEGKSHRYLVQWVGYSGKEATWEPVKKLQTIAPGELSRFEHENGPAPEAPVKKRNTIRGQGRPRKKAKTSDDGLDDY